ASARDWQSQSPPARKCPLIPSWTLIDVPTTGSILIYSHFVQTVLTSRLRRGKESVIANGDANSRHGLPILPVPSRVWSRLQAGAVGPRCLPTQGRGDHR